MMLLLLLLLLALYWLRMLRKAPPCLYTLGQKCMHASVQPASTGEAYVQN